MRLSPRLRRCCRVAASLFCGLAVISAVAYGTALVFGYRFFVEMSGSMRPTLPIGSLVMSDPQPGSSVHLGQIVTFLAPDGSGVTITHRLYTVVHHNGKTGFRTKGDANPVPDPWVVRFPHQVGVERLAIPYAGYLFYALSQRSTRLLLIALISVSSAYLLVRRIWRPETESLSRRRRRLEAATKP